MHNLLFIYSRDIELNDSGGARTTILLIKYLASHGYRCFCLFRIENFGDPNVIFIKQTGAFVQDVRRAVEENKISVIVIPEGIFYTSQTRRAIDGLDCKIISALHNKPGYERIRLHVLLSESFRFNDNFAKRLRALCLLAFYPLFYLCYTGLYYFKFRKTYNDSDKLVLLGEEFIPEFKGVYHVDGAKLAAIGNPISFNIFATEYDIDRKEKRVLMVTRFEERSKRVKLALEIWKELEDYYPEWQFDVVGFGRSLPIYEKYINDNNLRNVHLLGKKEPLEYYKRSSIFFMTSAYEGWGMTIVEAMQMGCVPIVMDSFSTLHSIIDHDVNGLITKYPSKEKFVTAARRLMDDADLRNNLACSAVEKSHSWEPENTSGRYLNLIQSLVGNK